MSGMAGGRDRGGDALLRAFARDLAKMRRDLRNLEAVNQISSASIEGGTLDVYDDDDVLRERIGKQANGSYGRLVLEGPVPPIPSEPDVQVIADGVVAITWDGRCEEKWPFVEFEAVRVHLVEDPVAEVCDRDNQVGLILSHRGETIVAVTESDDDNPVYARLVAVSSAGHVSDPSPAVLVDELDEDDLEEEQEELEWQDGDGHTLTAEDITAGSVTFGLSHIPEEKSLLAWWHPGGLAYAGEPQDPAQFSVDYEAQTITWTLTGCEAADDRLRLYYPYLVGAPEVTLVPFSTPGWKYLLVPQSDSTDYSAAALDDSGWTTGATPFGSTGTSYPVTTSWPGDKHLWLRRTIEASVTDVVVTIPVEDNAEVYVNGALAGVVSPAGGGFDNVDPPPVVTVANSLLDPSGGNVIAIKVKNESGGPASDPAWVDVQITGRYS